jgi:Ethanolamine utilization protein EutJ (predicted chaperonin)
MSSERIKKLLAQLRRELDTTDIDPETLSLVRDLDSDIQQLLDKNDSPVNALVQRAEAVEVKFAVNHRVAERILREIIDTLARMGV